MLPGIHFEIPADDIGRAKSFYTNLFNWEITEEASRPGYLVIGAKESMPASGSLLKRFNPKQATIVYFDVPSVSEYSTKVKELGGKIVVSKKAVPGTGYFAICHDTENNTFGIWEEDKNAI